MHFYNGHPYAHLPSLDLSKIDHVTIVGQGNVAFDCARILLAPIDELRKTDTPEYALAELARSSVKRVDVVGRRGPLQLAGTTKELREMMQLPNVGFAMDPALLAQAEQTLAEYPKQEGARMRSRLLKLMRDGSKAGPDAAKEWSLQFLRSPVSLNASDYVEGTDIAQPVRSVNWEINELVGDASAAMHTKAQGTGQIVTSDTDMVLKSVGYRSVGIPGVPFDDKKGTVRNINGRVTSDEGDAVRILFSALL